MVQNLYERCQFFLSSCLLFLGPKCPNTPILILPRDKNVLIPPYCCYFRLDQKVLKTSSEDKDERLPEDVF